MKENAHPTKDTKNGYARQKAYNRPKGDPMRWVRERLSLPYDGGWPPLKIEAEAVAEKDGADIYIKDKFGALSIFCKALKPLPGTVSLYGLGYYAG